MSAARSRTVAAAMLVAASALIGLAAAGAAPRDDRDAPGEMAAVPPRAGPDPSVVLITLDTTRADRIGCYGGAQDVTPHIDRLASRGVRFENALSPAPLTVPAHATLMTGLVPRRHGARDNAVFLLSDRGPATLAERLGARGYATAAAVGSIVLDRGAGLARGFERYDDDVRVGAREAFDWKERAAEQTVSAAISALASLDPPFFLWVHLFDPHDPYVPPEPYRSRFESAYDGEIAYADAQVGRLLEAVERRTEAPIVIVAGDHGESLGEHGERTHGTFVYQATQRVPLILAGPGLPRGRVVEETVGLVDVAPTVLELTGSEPFEDVDGISLVDVLARTGRGATDGPSERAYEMETLFPKLAYGWAPLHALVRDGFKYIDAPRDELYDLEDDPGETADLRTEDRDRRLEMRRELGARLASESIADAATGAEATERRARLASLGYTGGLSTGTTIGEAAIDPKDGIAWLADLDAGRRLVREGRPGEAVAALERLLARNPDNVPALLALSTARTASGDPQRGVAAARAADRIRSDDDLVLFNLANALAALADAAGTGTVADDGSGPTAASLRAEATESYERSLELNPRRAETWRNYVGFLERTGRSDEALEALEEVRRLEVRDPELAIRRAVALLRVEEVARAERAFVEAHELDPTDDRTVDALARLTARQSRFAEAAVWLERLLRLRRDPGAATALGDIRLERLGDVHGAIDAYREAAAALPPGDPARQTLERRIERLSRSAPPE